MPEPLLFANVGWMTRYEGQLDDDPTLGNHGWLKDHKWGHEAWNFKPFRGKVYGYVPGRSSKINLAHLGAVGKDESVSGVTVVFIARHPRTKQTRIVGWYVHAKVYRTVGHATLPRASDVSVQYQIEADAANATLLPTEQRQFPVPTKKVPGNLGQSPLWYGGTDQFRDAVRDYIGTGGVMSTPKPRGKGGSTRRADPEARKLIELAAVHHATTYYESKAGGSRAVQSVEADNEGWDLTVTSGGEELKVEVKGLTGTHLCVELTPNEYKQMQSSTHRADYVIYVVTEAATRNARSHVFYYNALLSRGRDHVWTTEDGRQLQVEKLIAARLTAV